AGGDADRVRRRRAVPAGLALDRPARGLAAVARDRLGLRVRGRDRGRDRQLEPVLPRRGPAGIAAVCADRAGEDARRRFPRHPRVHGVVRCAGGRGRRLGAGAWAGTGTGGVRRRRRRLRGARWTSVAPGRPCPGVQGDAGRGRRTLVRLLHGTSCCGTPRLRGRVGVGGSGSPRSRPPSRPSPASGGRGAQPSALAPPATPPPPPPRGGGGQRVAADPAPSRPSPASGGGGARPAALGPPATPAPSPACGEGWGGGSGSPRTRPHPGLPPQAGEGAHSCPPSPRPRHPLPPPLAGEGWGGGQSAASDPAPIPAFPRKGGRGAQSSPLDPSATHAFMAFAI